MVLSISSSVRKLEVQAPPVARSGGWLPGSTLWFAFVRPGTLVRWLPEQCDAESGEADASDSAGETLEKGGKPAAKEAGQISA